VLSELTHVVAAATRPASRRGHAAAAWAVVSESAA
jgi:hypothetical protein